MSLIQVDEYPNKVLSLCTGRCGIYFYDSKTLEMLDNHRFENEFIISQSYIKTMNLLISGSNGGSIRAHKLDGTNLKFCSVFPDGGPQNIDMLSDEIRQIVDIDTAI